MKFFIGQIQQLGMVAVIMACATGGTIGIIKVIKYFFPGIKNSGNTSGNESEK